MAMRPSSPIGATRLVNKQKGEHFRKQESKVQNLNYLAGNTVWVKVDTDELFVECTVKSVEGDQLKVNCKGEELLVKISDCLNSLPDFDSLKVNDLSKIPHANSAVVLKILRERFNHDVIYTYAGKLLVALNPFKKIPNLYDNNLIELYKKADTTLGFPTDLDPHTYAVGQCAINGLFNDNKNQSCIVSGESGAGKTETAKQLMNFFAYSRTNLNASTSVQDIILGSNALLESFGNAKTINNNNSSRFGKFLKLNLLPTGGIVGGEMSSYMLEISRVEFQNENERNFHLFYQVLKGLKKEELEAYSFMEVKDYNYLNQSNCYEAPGIDDVSDFSNVLIQLKKLFTPDRLSNFFEIISGILLCGNVDFVEESRMGVDSAAKLSNASLFKKLTELLGLDYDLAEKAMIEKVIKIQDNMIESPVTSKVAQVNVRALSKDLYGFLFQYIIQLINQFTSGKSDDSNTYDKNSYVGILDIYGFEYFKHNTYEQLLINFANEKLQKYFINNVFTSELSLYEREKIDVTSIVYSDNSGVLEIFEKKNCGIFPFLYEQCSMESGTSEAFTRSCNTRIKNENFIPPKGNVNEFTIVHTACKVVYNTDEFITKNKHSLSEVVVSLLVNSTNELLRDMVIHAMAVEASIECSPTNQASGRTSRTTRSSTKLFVGNKFLKSINELIKCLEETNSHFIRCVKTNQVKQPGVFDVKGVYGQLNSLSILEAVQIIHKGYAYKSSFANFIKDNQFVYNILIGGKSSDSDDTTSEDPEKDKENAVNMLKLLDIPEEEYQVGLTMIFLKKNGWILLEQSHLKFSQLLAPLSKLLNAYYQSYVNRKSYLKKLQMINRVQALARKFSLMSEKYKKLKVVNEFVGFVVVANWLNYEQKVLSSALVIQSSYRMLVQRRKYLNEIEQLRLLHKKRVIRRRLGKFKSYVWYSVFGLYLQRVYRINQVNKAATRIQATWRMHRCVSYYNHMRYSYLKDYAATVVQKNVRCFLQVKNYEFMRYAIPSVVLIQSYFRGWLVRKFVDSKVNVFKSIRNRLALFSKLYFIQNTIRSILSTHHFKLLKQDLSTLQGFFWTRCWYVEMLRIMWASKTIKRYWKSYKFRKLINSQKDELSQDLYKKEVQQVTRNEIITSLSLLQKYKYGLLPLHVNVSTKLDEFYPNGWSNSLSMVLRVNEDKQITNASMGMFHTVLVLNGTYVYTYGLNDYNQLGYTNRNESTGNVTFRDISVDKSIRLEPMVMIKEGLKVKDVTCGFEHTVMLLNDGSVYTWGLNRNGQCAQIQSHEVITTPTLVTFTNDCPVRVVTSGNYHVCCLNHDGELFVWGKAFHMGLNCSDLFRPMKLETKLNLKSVYAGKQVSYLLDQESNLYSFGTTYNGQLGYPSNSFDKSFELNSKSDEPGNLAYCGETSGSTIFRFVLNQVVDVSVGNNFTVAVDVYGNLWQWGTFLVVNSGTETFEQQTEYKPFLVKVDKKILKSPLAKVSVGWWEVNLLTESLSLYGYNYLRLEKKPGVGNSTKLGETVQGNSKVYSPILFSYPGLTGMLPKDVETLASPTITVTMVRTD